MSILKITTSKMSLKRRWMSINFIVFDSNRFNDTQERIFNALNNSDNKILLNILNQNNSEKIRDLVYATERSLKDVSSVLSSSLMLDMIGLNSQLAINNRLAKINNPYNANMALANIIRNLKDEPLTSTDDMALLSLVANKAQNPTNLYKSFIGAKAKVNTISPRIYGVTFGYDVLFQDLLLGSFVTYAKSKIDTGQINQKTNSYQAGIYSRYSFLNSELDTKLSLGISQNDITRMMMVDDRFYTNKAKYKSLSHSFAIDYGYLFRPNDRLFIKPIIGVSYFYSKNNKFKESGFLAIDFLKARSKSVTLNLATEFRYYNDVNYFYITPGVQREIYKRSDDININLANINIPISIKDKKHTYFTLQSGADFTLTNRLSVNANFGIKTSRSQRYYNGTIGVKFVF
ncbi:autotransporter outer membrane beta-barrel domain-containing protein [Campylobacter mucosalis]|uniref:autotransporter outer membrane beta-barrel domain-containing protein n=1 Tax=Campylobacter mucosalis TaxID=202 RepID=UPI00146FDC12|nr:autotransporter outer membrane beta-barrel domain-containing protein [Campylobacter mucosalis]